MNATTAAADLNEWLPANLTATPAAANPGVVTVDLGAPFAARISWDDTTANVQLREGYGVLGETHVGFTGPTGLHLIAAIVAAYADMVDAEVVA